jgi:hypothetical protein
MLDYIQDFGRVNPDWEDTLRPSRIPTADEQFGDDGQAMLSVKQSRFGVKAALPTEKGPTNTKFEFDLFGVGSDAGETTIRLRHAYGEFGQFLAGQTNSLFMDGDIFPNVIDYWAPPGMVYLRNPQIRWTPVANESSSFSVAIENPGNDIDSGQFREVADFPGAQGDEEWPDRTAQYRTKGDWGHVQVAGILRWIGAEVIPNNQLVYDDNDTGWGINLTTAINVLERDAIGAGVVYGEGIASYINAGYSWTEVDNTDGQTADTFEKGSYASANLLYYPVKNVMVGAELLWGDREDFGGADNDDTRLQISFNYDFGTAL